jgi:uncharacterized protein YjiS (DUF1127 family)
MDEISVRRSAMTETQHVPTQETLEKRGMLATLVARLGDWRERRRLAAEFDEMQAAGELDPLLADAGLSRAQVPTLLKSASGTRRLLERMAARLGVDLAAMPAPLRRDVEWTCASCGEQRHCRRWLKRGETAGYAAFCPNTPAFRRQLRAAANAECAVTGV